MVASERTSARDLGDSEALGAALDRLGWLPAEAGARALVLGRELFDGRLDGPSRLDAVVFRPRSVGASTSKEHSRWGSNASHARHV